MTKMFYTLCVKVKVLDIFLYLKKDYTQAQKSNGKTKPAVCLGAFQTYIGYQIPRSTLAG